MAFPEGLSSLQKEFSVVNKEKICNLYDNHATDFDEIVGTFTGKGQNMTINALNELVPIKSSRILDFAACTGLLGVKTHRSGFTNIDAFDGSQNCIEECKRRDIYTNFIVEFVTDAPLSIASDTYDGIICSGGFALNHLPISVLSEWTRIVKPGGYVISAFRNKWKDIEPMYNDGKFDNELQRLEKEGKWTFVRKELSDPENYEKCYILYIHQIL
ncbi:demethylmenaquinone methyltransferase-like [Antedon mediterranea]|uniref:demethylmenaquinone methyltransferase-like n=1 Tax=Antedon mediterranea TaxID=105859 RepID=UPI003AF94659